MSWILEMIYGGMAIPAILNQSWNAAGTGTLTLPDTSSLNLSGTFTIEGWMYSNSTVYSIPFSRAAANYQFQSEFFGTSIMFYITTDTGFFAVSRPTPVGEWFYFALVVDVPNGTMSLRINDEDNVIARTDITGTHNTYAIETLVSKSSDPFDGKFDELRFWNGVARTQTQLTANKGSFLVGNETGLVGYYKLDGDGTNYCTTTGDANNGEIVAGEFTTDHAPVS